MFEYTVTHRNFLRTHFYVKFQSFALTKLKLFDITIFNFFGHKTCTVRSTNKKKKIKKIYLHMLLLFLRLQVGNFKVTKVFCFLQITVIICVFVCLHHCFFFFLFVSNEVAMICSLSWFQLQFCSFQARMVVRSIKNAKGKRTKFFRAKNYFVSP